MQPPPRKGNYTKFLKNLHSEQIAKLLLKNQHECELLEDIRTFTIKRSAIEKSYSEALLKISSAYLNKKIPNIPDIKLDGGEEKWNMWNVWRTVLEENEKLARARLAAVEVFQQQIADDAKILRSHKVQNARKNVEQLSVIQKELQVCVQDVDKTKKLYFDEEHTAHDVRDKARDIEEKLKKKKGSFFQSITSLQKNSAKFSSKREQLEEKSSGARNDYLLCLSAANAHQNRYFVVDLQFTLSSMESNVFDKVAEYLTLMGRTELLTCSAMQNSFGTIRDQAKQLTREYNLQCCYLYYPVLKQHIQYDFEPCDNDPIEHVTVEHESAAGTLSKEARRWATRIARDNNTIRESVRKLQIYNALRESGQKVDPNDQNGPDLDTKIEEMKQSIRRAETSKQKAEARIECLRKGGVNVDEWLQEAETLNVQDIQRSTSSLSMRTDASGTGDHPSSDSFYDSDYADGETTTLPMEKPEKDDDVQSEQFENPEVDAVLEQERQRIEQLTAGWDDPTQVDWGAVESEPIDGMITETTPSGPVLKCTALYSYTAQNPDELTIVENEQLEVVGEGDGDGWLRARNYKGEEGYVPQNYLDVEREQTSTTPGLVNQISFSSVDYTIDNEDEVLQNTETNQSPEQVSVISAPQKDESNVTYCCALYDYEGDGEEELTFDEGQVIRIISRCAHSVDDGWWKGEFEGKIGNFPSLVVEECDEYGEPLTNQWDDTPPCSAPPVFTPPEMPEFLDALAEDDDVQPMPGEDVPPPPQCAPPQCAPPPPPPECEESEPSPSTGGGFSFSMTMSEDHHHQYDAQFEMESENKVPTIDIPSVIVGDEDEDENERRDSDDGDFGLGVAQIVITAATPMVEEADHGFPPIEESPTSNEGEENVAESMDEGNEDFPHKQDDDILIDESKFNTDNNDLQDKQHYSQQHGTQQHYTRQKDTQQQDSQQQDSQQQDSQHQDSQQQDSQQQDSQQQDIQQQEERQQSHHDHSQTIQQQDSQCAISSSTCSDGDTTGPSTAENSIGPAHEDITEPKQVVGGRASIPDELEPHQLARLQDLKESNA